MDLKFVEWVDTASPFQKEKLKAFFEWVSKYLEYDFVSFGSDDNTLFMTVYTSHDDQYRCRSIVEVVASHCCMNVIDSELESGHRLDLEIEL